MIGWDQRISTSFLGLPATLPECSPRGLELHLKQGFPHEYQEEFFKLARTYRQTPTPSAGPLAQTLNLDTISRCHLQSHFAWLYIVIPRRRK